MTKHMKTPDLQLARPAPAKPRAGTAESPAPLGPLRARLVPWLRSARRAVLQGAATVAPGLTARLLARRYLAVGTWVDTARIEARGIAQFIALGEDAGILRHAPFGETVARRVLLVHGHEGHVRQFARLIRALRQDGAQVDALILPGHLKPGQGHCSMAGIVAAITRAAQEQGPYNAVIAHCVGASGLLFALDGGLGCARVVLVSAPLEVARLVRYGGTQYGIGGRCLDAFVHEVSRAGAPYALETPWRPMAEHRREACLVVHARDDYAAPVSEVEALPGVWPGAQAAIFDEGDHNGIIAMAPAIAEITAFVAAEPEADAAR